MTPTELRHAREARAVLADALAEASRLRTARLMEGF